MSEDMRQELDGLKAEVREVNAGLKALGVRMDARFEALEGMMHRLIRFAVGTEETVREMDAYMRGKLVTREEFDHRMDAYAGKAKEADFSLSRHTHRLDEHGERIKRLEDRSS